MNQNVQSESFVDALNESKDFQFIDGFVAGAKWWEFRKTGFTMWQGDQKIAEGVALRRMAESDGGVVSPENENRFVAGFVEGAKWWQFHKYDVALKSADQAVVKAEAIARASRVAST